MKGYLERLAKQYGEVSASPRKTTIKFDRALSDLSSGFTRIRTALSETLDYIGFETKKAKENFRLIERDNEVYLVITYTGLNLRKFTDNDIVEETKAALKISKIDNAGPVMLVGDRSLSISINIR